MMQPIHIKIIAWIAACTFAATLYATGQTVTWQWVRAVSTPVVVLSALFWLFDRYLWKFRLFHGWLVRRPNLSGTWQVTFQSTWVDPKTKQQIGPKIGEIQVRQTYSNLTFQVETEESLGSLVASELLRDIDGTYRFCGSYLNEPKAKYREKSQIHYGTFLLKVEGPSHAPSGLRGAYWTDRKTTGEMSATRHRNSQLLPARDL